MNCKNKGDKKGQNKRRRERAKHLPKRLTTPVELIDGNVSMYAVGYCAFHCACVTEGLMETHRCKERHCKRLVMFEHDNIQSDKQD